MPISMECRANWHLIIERQIVQLANKIKVRYTLEIKRKKVNYEQMYLRIWT